jgi:glycosyltransferase involved in cell wall biosynthesis
MNILQICANYPPLTSGYAKYAQSLSRSLFKYDVRTNFLTCKPPHGKIIEKRDEFPVQRISTCYINSIEYPIFTPDILLHIDKIIKQNDIDVINTHTRFYTSSLFAHLYKYFNDDILFVHTEHGAGPLVHNNKLVSSMSRFYDSTFGKWTLKKTDIPIAIGPSSKKFMEDLGCKKEIAIIPNSINCSQFEKLSKKSANKMTNEIIITFIGRLVESKGVSDLIYAFSKIENEYDVRLWIVGNGPDDLYFKHLANSLHIKKINFLGFRDDIPDILAQTDIFVSPSYYDSVPTTILEAGCIGTRVISSNVGDVPYIVGEDYPYLYNTDNLRTLKEHLIQVIEESDFKADKLQKRIYEMFNWDENSKKYLNLLNNYL